MVVDGAMVLLVLDRNDGVSGRKFIVPAMLFVGKLVVDSLTKFDSHSSSATSSLYKNSHKLVHENPHF